MRSIIAAGVATALAVACAAGAARADDAAARNDLAPTAKLHVGIAVAPSPGAGDVACAGRWAESACTPRP